MNAIDRLRRIHSQLLEILDTEDLGEATESADRALDQLLYAIEELGASVPVSAEDDNG